MNATFSLKVQLFNFKMLAEATVSIHANNLRTIIKQLAVVNAVVDVEGAKTILLNSFLLKYNIAIFTFSQPPSQILDKMIATFLVE